MCSELPSDIRTMVQTLDHPKAGKEEMENCLRCFICFFYLFISPIYIFYYGKNGIIIFFLFNLYLLDLYYITYFDPNFQNKKLWNVFLF